MKKIGLIVTMALVIWACSSSDDTPEEPANKDAFNRELLLVNVADNIIIPAFEDLSAKLVLLKSAKDTFVATPNQTNLDAFRASWLTAYKVWQHVEMFNIGKAEELSYGFQMNIYPTSVEDITNNIASASYDLTHPNNNDAVGFPALDYLLYGVADTDVAILEKYTNATNGDAHKNYTSDLVNQMESLTTTVLADWKSSFRNVFVKSTANTATSSLNKLVNDFVFYYEKGLRANKIGIPAGVFSASPLATKVEAFYQKTASKELTLEALKAVQDFFNGKSYAGTATGESFSSYLDYLNGIKKGADIKALVNSKIDNARTKIQALSNDYSNQVTTDNSKMTEAYDALQAVVVLIKVDMLQAFSVSVDYTDADGD